MNYWKRVRKIMRKSNVVLEIIDARFPNQTRNVELEKSALKADKKLVIVINKSDLVSKHEAIKLQISISKEFPALLFSARERKGKYDLMRLLKIFSAKKELFVCVLGYPNTGKSSIINYLRGKRSAPASSTAGQTKGEQLIRLDRRIMLVDTPGVMPFFKGGEATLTLVAAKNPQALKNPEKAVQKIFDYLRHNGETELWGVELAEKSAEQLLEEIAMKKKRLKKGGEPDTSTITFQIIRQWQNGKITLKKNAG